MKDGLIFQKDQEWIDIGPGVSRQIYSYNDQVMMVRVRFEQGAVGDLHQHPHCQSSYVASGVFEVTINRAVALLSAGDAFLIEPNVVHGCVCKEAGILVDVFTPKRDDFL